MQAGDFFEINGREGWYLWLKHKIKPGSHPMSLASGEWIVDVLNGPSPAAALAQGAVFTCVAILGRKDKKTKIGSLPVSDVDLVYPLFYRCGDDSEGNEIFTLCDGYEELYQVAEEEQFAEVPFRLQFFDGVVASIDDEDFERERLKYRVDNHPGFQHKQQVKKATTKQAKKPTKKSIKKLVKKPIKKGTKKTVKKKKK